MKNRYKSNDLIIVDNRFYRVISRNELSYKDPIYSLIRITSTMEEEDFPWFSRESKMIPYTGIIKDLYEL